MVAEIRSFETPRIRIVQGLPSLHQRPCTESAIPSQRNERCSESIRQFPGRALRADQPSGAGVSKPSEQRTPLDKLVHTGARQMSQAATDVNTPASSTRRRTQRDRRQTASSARVLSQQRLGGAAPQTSCQLRVRRRAHLSDSPIPSPKGESSRRRRARSRAHLLTIARCCEIVCGLRHLRSCRFRHPDIRRFHPLHFAVPQFRGPLHHQTQTHAAHK